MAILSSRGWLIAFFPNGSEVFQKANPAVFHRLWGQVHPVMLNENFVRNVLPGASTAIGAYCDDDLEALKHWDRATCWTGTLNTNEMLVVWVNNCE